MWARTEDPSSQEMSCLGRDSGLEGDNPTPGPRESWDSLSPPVSGLCFLWGYHAICSQQTKHLATHYPSSSLTALQVRRKDFILSHKCLGEMWLLIIAKSLLPSDPLPQVQVIRYEIGIESTGK